MLLHITSLPGKYGIGDLGPAAFQWIDMLSKAGQSWWQMLPLGPVGEGNSPYRCYSAFAGNPLLINPDLLLEDGLLSQSDLRAAYLPAGKVNYAKVARNKTMLLQKACDRFRQTHAKKWIDSFQQFVSCEAHWLDDFALFMALRQSTHAKSWTDWPKPILRRQPSALSEARSHLSEKIQFHQFAQFLFFRQLQLLRKHAHAAGVQLIGDLPIFVSPESVDVWTHPQLFQLDRQMRPTAVSGVPPDLFSATGQRWGNPLYNWKEMEKDQFSWWKARLRSALSQADLVRIDHFRGFEAYWRVPANAPDARTGKWIKGPGAKLFRALLSDHPHLPLLAEDLGIITPQVEALRDQFNLPGMRVLQFGFTPEPGNPHTPHNFVPHCFAYTGTHDNDTAVSWYQSLPLISKRRLEKYSPGLNWKTDPAGALIRVLSASVASHVIVPLQDLLRLGSSARMNTPGQSENNWEWRLESFAACTEPLAQLAELSSIYQRASS